MRGYPAVSVLMSTTPAAAMSAADAQRLDVLVHRAVDRLLEEHLGGVQHTVVPALRELATRVQTEPTRQAVALYVSAATSRSVRLGVSVLDRVAVDPTFATRDLVRALHRTPAHLVLVFTAQDAVLLSGTDGTLRSATTRAFPVARRDFRRQDPDHRGWREPDAGAFLRSVDRRLGAYRALHPSPLVILGPAGVVSAFTDTAKHAYRLAGVLPGNHVHASLPELAGRVRPVIERYLLSRERQALDLVASSGEQSRVAFGMPAAWLAARTQRPEMLAVEHGLYYPARLSADGDTLTPADDVEDPEVIDDAVDELIEVVLDRGGWVALVADGSLAEHHRVALVVR